jgi:hypothetical protein
MVKMLALGKNFFGFKNLKKCVVTRLQNRVAFPCVIMIKLWDVWCSFGAVAVTKHGLYRHLGRSSPIIAAFYGEKITGWSPRYSMENP